MSHDLVRRCDSCRKEIDYARPVYVVAATIQVVGGRRVGLDHRDACGEPCALNLFRSLFREAALAPAEHIVEPRGVGQGVV